MEFFQIHVIFALWFILWRTASGCQAGSETSEDEQPRRAKRQLIHHQSPVGKVKSLFGI